MEYVLGREMNGTSDTKLLFRSGLERGLGGVSQKRPDTVGERRLKSQLIGSNKEFI
jgi:hypothetical protein